MKQFAVTDLKDKDTVWRQAQSIITDVAVQVGALINGVSADLGEASVPAEPIKTWTIRFSWAGAEDAMDHHGLMRIAMSPADDLVKIHATPLDPPDVKLLFERAIPMWELDSQKLGQVLLDAHAWIVRKLTPGLHQTATRESQAETEESVWSRIKSLALTQSTELSVQI